MASSKNPPGTGAANAPIIPYQRRGQLLGLILVSISFSVFLSLISFDAGDKQIIQENTFMEAFLSQGDVQIKNWLGLLGAYIAETLIPGFLGYPVLVLPIIGFAWGWLFITKRDSLYLPIYTTYGILGAFEIACFFGWLEVTFEVIETPLMSGAVGYSLADAISRALGSFGSLFAIFIAMLMTFILLVDRDLDETIARIEEATGALSDLISSMFKFVLGVASRTADRIKEEGAIEDAVISIEQNTSGSTSDLTLEEATAPQLEKAAKAKKDMNLLEFQKAYATKEEVEDSESTAASSSDKHHHTARTVALSSETTDLNESLRQQIHQRYGSTTTSSAASTNQVQATPPPSDEPPPPVEIELNPNTRKAPSGQLELTIQKQVKEERTDRVANSAANIQLNEIRFRYPSVELLDRTDGEVSIDYSELEENKQVLLDALATYNIAITDINAIVGPTITMYELTPAPGIKISKIKALEDDLAMAMAARGIRMVAPIPGKSAIGVEIPNRQREIVRLRDLIATKRFRDNKMRLPLPLGKTIEGQVSIHDIASMPHLLIAGATGSGKSVCLNALITSLLYACHPSNLKFVMIDPKKIELQQYSRIVDHYLALPPESESPIITDVSQALGVLRSCEREMDFRYNLLQKAMVRGLHEYNLKFRNGELSPDEGHRHFPYLVVVVDELADLMLTAGKEIEAPIARLAQMARAVGIHLVLATQRPSVDVITGLIKANFPARVAFQVASKVDSRTILDQNGAEGLVGNGDMLYMKGSHMTRLQGPFVSVEEVDLITEFIADQTGPGPYYLPSFDDTPELTVQSTKSEAKDDLFAEAARIIVENQQGSVSLLQRKLSVGYTRAARIVDQLENAGIVGPFEGSKARQVLVPDEIALQDVLSEI